MIRRDLKLMCMEMKLKEGSVKRIKAEEKCKGYESLLRLCDFFYMSPVSGLCRAERQGKEILKKVIWPPENPDGHVSQNLYQ